MKLEIDKVKEIISLKKNEEAITILENCKMIIEEYADSYSKNQNIKKESVKRNERINIIDKNSAFSNNHSTAEEKNANTRFIADLTGLFIVITPIELIITKHAKIQKPAISLFIIYYYLLRFLSFNSSCSYLSPISSNCSLLITFSFLDSK